ncbi:MAG: 4Fe-4S binding protein [bacterium]|nr:4Fe-4S binding protein [bacterium]
MKKSANPHRPLARPGSVSENRTGFWRTQKPIFDEKLCTSCSRCAKLCPDACIIMRLNKEGKLKAQPDYDYCKGCGLCAAECPFSAIAMKPE